MRFLRYWLYAGFWALLAGAALLASPWLARLGLVLAAPGGKALAYLVAVAVLPLVRGFSQDLRPPPALPEGARRDYLRQEASWSLPATPGWEARVKEALNGLGYGTWVFTLRHEEEGFVVYRSEEAGRALEEVPGRRPRRRRRRRARNPLIVEAEEVADRRLELRVHKARTYVELSNRDNEEVLSRLLGELGEPIPQKESP